ncbi:MAG: potassium channel family protein [Muribaculaceae bacterium]|nr:potassium channel family protein [Muribaculaceae bacterium]
MKKKISDWLLHFFHVVSNIRPIVWIATYVALTPVFALIYWALPDGQFRIPDGGTTDYGSWLYYSIVTITTLGFGDYTPAHGWAQAVTAIEVMCGLVFLGFFLNAVGSMKSEIDVASEVEKQRQVHFKMEKEKLMKIIPGLMHNLNNFLAYCYALTTPMAKRNSDDARYNPDFTFNDLSDLFKPSGLAFDGSSLPVVGRFMKSASQTSLMLDSLQQRVDLTLWPELVDDCFAFVADYQMFSSEDVLTKNATALLPADSPLTAEVAESKISKEIADWNGPLEFAHNSEMQAIGELYYFVKESARVARNLETALTTLSVD